MRKEVIYLHGVPIRLSADCSTKNFADKKGLGRSIQSDEKQRPTSKTALPSKAIV